VRAGDTGSRAAGPVRPVARLWRQARPHRRRVALAAALTSVNKVADVVPELLIGAAVDVLVRGGDALVAGVTGVESRFGQLAVLAAVNVVVWSSSP